MTTYAFSVDKDDKVMWIEIRGLYPKMKFARLINMIARQWLENRKDPKNNELKKRIQEILNEF